MIPALAPSRQEKERRFARFGEGWDAFMRAEPDSPPGAWSLKDRDLWLQGYRAAARAAERFRSNP